MKYQFEGSKGTWFTDATETEVHAEGGKIIEVFSDKELYHEMTANAHLVAAAPELLKACIDLSELLNALIGLSDNGSVHRQILCEAQIQNLTAIHKALNINTTLDHSHIVNPDITN